jgi:hypothetical protein
LSAGDKQHINFSQPDKLRILVELRADAELSKQISIDKRWKFVRKSGETVVIRDVFEKIVRWVDTFKQVGDIAVQYDPIHASLPWAGIRFLLQVRSGRLLTTNLANAPKDRCQPHSKTCIDSGRPCGNSRVDLSLRSNRSSLQTSGLES